MPKVRGPPLNEEEFLELHRAAQQENAHMQALRARGVEQARTVPKRDIGGGSLREDVFYGRIDNTRGYKRYACVVVRTSETASLKYYDCLDEPCGCQYDVLAEYEAGDLMQHFPDVLSPNTVGWLEEPLCSRILEHWRESASASAPQPKACFPVDSYVRVIGLQSSPEYNNLIGQVVALPNEKGRIGILVATSNHKKRGLNLQPANLEAVAGYLFVGVPEYILEALDVHNWPEAVDIREECVQRADIAQYRVMVTTDSMLGHSPQTQRQHGLARDPADEHLKAEACRFFKSGGHVVVIACDGIFSSPKGVLSPLFGCDWDFNAYTRHEFVLTPAGAAHLGGAAGEAATQYMKGNFLRVPGGEALLRPKLSSFEDEYGYPESEADPEEVQEFSSRTPVVDTPVAIHEGDLGRLTWLGFVNYGHEEAAANIARKLICTHTRAKQAMESPAEVGPDKERIDVIYGLLDDTPGAILGPEYGCVVIKTKATQIEPYDFGDDLYDPRGDSFEFINALEDDELIHLFGKQLMPSKPKQSRAMYRQVQWVTGELRTKVLAHFGHS